ncbi:metallophosphoesterase [Gilvimarinus sp. SDUM040013]|uniref:Metallophosphoesterase n=1 Tax=Gilvimarinus gilvus TaxID=3058038 RepID=A0ABU4RZF2_9GAMM|nr:metallophosphoesterase [Gilvimarinus sp. SDUM040013]MDO3388151.1 metallophosphoesterase [Gilvimarinus sp. SDUM040013]MDX6850274.1 metallophosphoesterase [Gilvimarinus sp. SDUM040013]
MSDESLTISVASDLHLEFYKDWKSKIPHFDQDSDVIILAGDIATGDRIYGSVREIAEVHPHSEIVVIAGNHEYYNCEYTTRLAEMRNEFAKIERVHFLENDGLLIKGYRILGCTLWTGFDIWDDSLIDMSKNYCRHSISDFHAIHFGGRCLEPDDIASLYESSRSWLAQELAVVERAKSIVVTHFPPCEETTHPGFGIDAMTTYFQANCIDLINEYQPALWVYGHNHWSQDLRIKKTRLYSNQLGYPNEQSVTPAFSLGTVNE